MKKAFLSVTCLLNGPDPFVRLRGWSLAVGGLSNVERWGVQILWEENSKFLLKGFEKFLH